MEKKTVIITHGATYHADEILACALLHVFHCPNAPIIRTLEPEKEIEKILSQQTDVSEIFVLDIGKRFGPERRMNKDSADVFINWFDHHQDISLGCSATLIMNWLECNAPTAGIAELIGLTCADWLPGVCAHDRGLDRTPYGTMTLSRLIAASLPTNPQIMDECFNNQRILCEVFVSAQREAAMEKMRNKSIVDGAINAALQESRGYVVTDTYIRDFINVLKLRHDDMILYYVYPHLRGGWSLQAVSKVDAMESRKPLVDEYCVGATFIHGSKFLATFPTKEEAIKAAELHTK